MNPNIFSPLPLPPPLYLPLPLLRVVCWYVTWINALDTPPVQSPFCFITLILSCSHSKWTNKPELLWLLYVFTWRITFGLMLHIANVCEIANDSINSLKNCPSYNCISYLVKKCLIFHAHSGIMWALDFCNIYVTFGNIEFGLWLFGVHIYVFRSGSALLSVFFLLSHSLVFKYLYVSNYANFIEISLFSHE